MEIELEGKTYAILEMGADEAMNFLESTSDKQRNEANKLMVSKCTGMTLEDVTKLPAKIFMPLLTASHMANGIGNFPLAKVK